MSNVITAERPVLCVEDLHVEYRRRGRAPVTAVKGVSFGIGEGETLGLVGESGSGKSSIGRAIVGLLPSSRGRVSVDGRDRTNLRPSEARRRTREAQMVFQDPYSSLNPGMTIGDILSEPLRANGFGHRESARRVGDLLDAVAMPAGAGRRYVSEFSGGQRQRVAIARALALEPRVLVCDEPVSALDLSTQARVLDLFIEIQQRTGVAYLFISHDLSVVKHVSHRVAVLYHGEIVEAGDCGSVTEAPAHPYTRQLLLAAPLPDPARQRARRAAFEALTRWTPDAS